MAARPTAKIYGGIDRRRWRRYAVGQDTPATLVIDGAPYACVIEDVSLAGAKLRVPAATARGAIVEMRCEPAGAIVGRCVWTGLEAIGVSFGLCDRAVALALSCIRRTLANPGPAADAG